MSQLVIPEEKHLTGSALVLSEETPTKVLLVHHKKSGTWLQPGGHADLLENPLEAAVRETKEETGVDISFVLKRVQKVDNICSILPTPDFFLEETIKAHADQPRHYHLDMIYLVKVPMQKVIRQLAEASDIGWFSLEDTKSLPMFENTRIMLEKVMR